jgi:response regulator RpfG family c-di-GMP phosphodiesterase
MIRSRSALIVLVAAGQLICLSLGLALFGRWLGREVGSLVRDGYRANNIHTARQTASIVELMKLSDLRVGSDDWGRLQAVIETVRLPNEGFVCVVSNTDGSVLCHPQFREREDLRQTRPGLAVLHGLPREAAIIEAARSSSEPVTGWADLPNGRHLVAAYEIAPLNATVLIHRPETAVVLTVERVLGPVRRVGVLVVVAMALVGTCLTWFIMRKYENRLAAINENLEDLVNQRSRALLKTRDAVIFGLAKLTESRDTETGDHLERIRAFVEVLAEEMVQRRRNLPMSPDQIRTLGLASSLHDVGKVGVPDAVLRKPGHLTDDERRVIEKHPVIGGETLLAIMRKLGEDDFLANACQITFAHHERWDGAGYPFQLQQEDIPWSARLVALADVYDALTSRRVYKPSLSHEQARDIIVSESGSHFDPAVVEAFLAREQQFRAIAEKGVSAAED